MDDDPSAPSPRHASAREHATRERKERLEKALERIPEMEAKKKAGEKAKARVSTTDPSATVMKMADGGFRSERKERLEKALERIPEMEAKKKAGEKAKARVSTTDPSATVMKMADGGF